MAERTFTPPAGAAVAARRAIKWIEDGKAGDGFTAVGRRRASQLASRQPVSLSTVKRMNSFLSRHAVDKKGEGFFDKADPSPGRVAWDAWGGDAARPWARRIVEAAKSGSLTVRMSDGTRR